MERKRLFIIVLQLLFAQILMSQFIWIPNESVSDSFIIHDEMDGFFNKIQAIEISIQLKDSTLAKATKTEALRQYKQALVIENIAPSKDEHELLREVAKEAISIAQPLLKKYPLPDTLFLGVLKGELYGDGVFYTRMNGIFIPQSMLTPDNKTILRNVLLHEFFHIQSRYYPTLQEQLYKTIGFIKLEKPPIMTKHFKEEILVNPDGTDWEYAIELKKADKKVIAYPMIVANHRGFTKTQANFFDYLRFNLYELEEKEGEYHVKHSSTPLGYKGLNASWFQPFYQKITDNTDYIIHPDEIMADNFQILALRLSGKEYNLSAEGLKLQNKIESVYGIADQK